MAYNTLEEFIIAGVVTAYGYERHKPDYGSYEKPVPPHALTLYIEFIVEKTTLLDDPIGNIVFSGHAQAFDNITANAIAFLNKLTA